MIWLVYSLLLLAGCAGTPASVSLPTTGAVPLPTPALAVEPEEDVSPPPLPPEGGEKRGDVWVFPYVDGRVHKVGVMVDAQTDFQLAPGETLYRVTPVDTKRWVVAESVSGEGKTQRAHVYVTPTEENLNTTIGITSSSGSYHLALISSKKGYKPIVRWQHPRPVQTAQKYTSPVRERSTAWYSVTPLAAPVPAWLPTAMWDDSVKTYIQFPAATVGDELPVLYVLDADGQPQLVNYRYAAETRIMEVDRIFRQGELRVGIDKRKDVVRVARHG